MFQYPSLEDLISLKNSIENVAQTKLSLFSPYFQHVGFST